MAKRRRSNDKMTKKLISFLVMLIIAIAAGYLTREKREPAVHGDIGVALAIPQFTKATESQIIEHIGYTVSYNQKRRNPNWVAYELTAEEVLGDEERGDDFIPDPEVRGRQATDDDYRKSGWDRGHLAPAADMKWSKQAMTESFYLSNISPQNNNLNRGVWKSIEELTRENATRYGKVLVVTGPVFTTGKGLGSIGHNKVAIPNSFFKVLLIESGGYRGIGFYCKNVAGRKRLSSYAMSIDSIEEITGIDFFPTLPDDIENSVEKEFDWNVWK